MPDMNENQIDDRLEAAAERMAKAAGEWARDARQRAETLKTDAAKQMLGAAEALRREAREANADSGALHTVDEVAGQLEKAAVFLKNNTFEQAAASAARKVEQSAQDNPWRGLLIALVIGVVIGLLLRGGRK